VLSSLANTADEAALPLVGMLFTAKGQVGSPASCHVRRSTDVLHGGRTTIVIAAFTSYFDEMRVVSMTASQVSVARHWMTCCCVVRL